MCYTAQYLLEKALKRARHYGVREDVVKYEEELRYFKNLYVVSGFSHPQLIIYTNTAPYHPILSQWGLIPHWVKSFDQAKDLRNKTLNAKGETLFDKPSFRDAVKNHRCLIPASGFYEYYHYNKKAYPFFICRKDHEPLMLAGLWSIWHNKETNKHMNTCSIVTTQANILLKQLHNNPNIKEPRMPLILSADKEEAWLLMTNKNQLEQILKPFPAHELTAYPVQKITGTGSVGNIPAASQPYAYEELSEIWKNT